MAQHMAGGAVTGRIVPPMPERQGASGRSTRPSRRPTTACSSSASPATSTGRSSAGCSIAPTCWPTRRSPATRTASSAGRSSMPIITEIVQRHTLDQMVAFCEEGSLPFAPLGRPEDLQDDPQLNAGGRMLDTDLGKDAASSCRACRSSSVRTISACASSRRRSARAPNRSSASLVSRRRRCTICIAAASSRPEIAEAGTGAEHERSAEEGGDSRGRSA